MTAEHMYCCLELHFPLWWLSICGFGLLSEISGEQVLLSDLISKLPQTARKGSKDSKLQTQPDASSSCRRQVLWWCAARNFTHASIKSETEGERGKKNTCSVYVPARVAMSQGATVSLNKYNLENGGGCRGSRDAGLDTDGKNETDLPEHSISEREGHSPNWNVSIKRQRERGSGRDCEFHFHWAILFINLKFYSSKEAHQPEQKQPRQRHCLPQPLIPGSSQINGITQETTLQRRTEPCWWRRQRMKNKSEQTSSHLKESVPVPGCLRRLYRSSFCLTGILSLCLQH